MRFLVLALLAVVAVAELSDEAPAITPELIKEIRAARSTWEPYPYSKFLTQTVGEVKSTLGVLPDSQDKWFELALREESPTNYAPPDNFDSRDQWGKTCPSVAEVRDQAACGSCWAFGAVEAMTDRHCIATNGTKKPHISAQDMLACCTSCGMGCEGGYPSAAWQYWVSQGVVTGGNYGIKGGCQAYSIPNCDHHCTGKYPPCGSIVPTPPCKKQCDDGSDFKTSKQFGGKAYGVSGVVNIQNDIQKSGPVEAAFSVYQDFLTYKTGVYQHTTGSMLGGHAVKILGWGLQGTTPYWLVANSWNEDWGDQGFFKILRGKNECGIEGQIVAGTPK
jgi:cathepsin B